MQVFTVLHCYPHVSSSGSCRKSSFCLMCDVRLQRYMRKGHNERIGLLQVQALLLQYMDCECRRSHIRAAKDLPQLLVESLTCRKGGMACRKLIPPFTGKYLS